MAAENSVICVLEAMDRLWFHQIIFFAEPSLFPVPKTCETLLPSSKNNSETSLSTDQESLVISETVVTEDELSIPESESETMSKERQTRLSNVVDSNKARSSSRSAEKYWRNLGSIRRLQKTVSCKSLEELELEEAKGFMDLGFVFEKEKISKRMMSLIPGLQRLEKLKYKEKDVYQDDNEHDNEDENENENEQEDEDEDDDDESRCINIMRPYLSESWLIRRPDSPLLNLRVPRTSTAADMKKYIKYWARTVASSIHQES